MAGKGLESSLRLRLRDRFLDLVGGRNNFDLFFLIIIHLDVVEMLGQVLPTGDFTPCLLFMSHGRSMLGDLVHCPI